jgi:hypothetical protein
LIIIFGANFQTPAPEYGAMKSSWFFGYVLMIIVISGTSKANINYIKNAIEHVAICFFPVFCYFFLNYITSDLNIFSRFDLNNSNPIIIAQLFLLFFISLVTSEKSGVMRRCLSLVYLLMAIMTGSKGPLVGLFIGGILLSYSFFRLYKMYIFMLLLSILCGYLLYSVNTSEIMILDYVLNRFFGDSSSNSVSSRLDMYFLAINGVSNFGFWDFLFGKGTGSFGYLYSGKDEIMYPHNIIIEALYELGILFTVTFFSILLVLLFRTFIVALNEPSNKVASFSFLFGCLAFVSSMFTGDLASNLLIYLFIGIALSEVGLVKRKKW